MMEPQSSVDLSASQSDTPKAFTVSELTSDVRAILESAFDSVWVEGEISSFRVAQSQHAYFVLKDERSQIRCVLFRNQRTGMQFTPDDGDQVLLFGRMAVYEARGEYQIIVENMEPKGMGALQKAFEKLKAKLEKEGLFAEARKRPLPEFPWKIGVVTSPTGAVIRDILNVLRRRNPKVSVVLYPVKVQGEGSALEIAEAIRELNKRTDIDTLIVGRGGGSLEDLWAFNEEPVARAIFDSRIPVISAVGHEIDFTIADFVADLRAPTPSAAAELVAPVLKDTVDSLSDSTRSMIQALESTLESHRQNLRQLIDRRFFREPRRILETPAQRLDDTSGRLLRALSQWSTLQRQRASGWVNRLVSASPQKQFQSLETQRSGLEHLLLRLTLGRLQLEKERLDGVFKNLDALSPLNILNRGYSITTDNTSGTCIKSIRQVKAGDQVRVRLSEGHLDCTVDGTQE